MISPYTQLEGPITHRSQVPSIDDLRQFDQERDLPEARFATSKDLAIDITLTNFVRAYKFEDQIFAGDIIAPPRRVRSRSGKWKTRGMEATDIYTSDMAADRSETNEIGFAVGANTYYIDTRRLKCLVTDEEIEERGPIDPPQEAVILLKHALKLRQEMRVVALAAATAYTVTIATDWDTSGTVTTDITGNKIIFENTLGAAANRIVFGSHVADELVANLTANAPGRDIVTAAGMQDPAVILEQLDGRYVMKKRPWGLMPSIPNVMYNSADKGQTRVLTRVWDQDAYLVLSDPSNRSMGWAIQPELLAPTVVRWRNDDPGGWYYKLMMKRTLVTLTPQAIRRLADVT